MLLEFKIQLSDISKPAVWRRVKLPANRSFYDFHILIQEAFGWQHAHLFRFESSDDNTQMIIEPAANLMDASPGDFWYDAEEIALAEVFEKEGDKLNYLYDFGDGWLHTIKLEKIINSESDAPVLVDGKGACPPEDCGGPWAYEDFKEKLSIPDHPDADELREWMGMEEGEVWDANNFDLDEARIRIASLGEE